MGSVRQAAAVTAMALLATGCGSAAPRVTEGNRAPTTSPSTSTPPPVSAPVTTTQMTAVPPSTTTRATAAPTTTLALTTTVSAVPDARLADVGSAEQAVVVTAPRYGATSATLTAYDRTAAGWRVAFGPWSAWVGVSGVAPPGAKREGDGRTPSGAYGFDFFFGVSADPGVRYPYRQVGSRSIVWDDDPASPRYNQWVDQAAADAGADPEPMYVTPAYDYGAVVAYNTVATPGLGSAIFLHVSTGGPTAGCVSLPEAQLLEVLRWLDPARQPRIALGVAG